VSVRVIRAERYCEHDKDEAVESHTVAVIIRISDGIDNKVMRSMCTIYVCVGGVDRGLVL
jgi:hypothetical protein